MKAITVFLAFFLVFSLPILGFGQKKTDELFFLVKMIGREPNGHDYEVRNSGVFVMVPDDYLTDMKMWFCGELAIRELEISDSQVEEIESFISTSFPKLGKESSERQCREFSNLLEEILTPLQLQSAIELYWCGLLERNGILGFVENEEVGRELGIGGLDLRASHTALKIEVEAVSRSRNELKSHLLKEFYTFFNEEELRYLKRDWGANLEACSLSQLYWFFKFDRTAFDTKGDFGRFRGAIQHRSILGDGVVRAVKVSGEAETEEVNARDSLVLLFTLLSDELVRDMFDISADQMVDIERIRLEYAREQVDVSLQIAIEAGVPYATEHITSEDGSVVGVSRVLLWNEFTGNRNTIASTTADAFEEIATKRKSEVESVLLPPQLESIEEVNLNRKIRAFGPIADLAFGDLKRWILLSSDREQQLSKLINRLAEYLERESCKEFERSFLGILETTPKEVRKKVPSEKLLFNRQFVDLDTWLASLRATADR